MKGYIGQDAQVQSQSAKNFTKACDLNLAFVAVGNQINLQTQALEGFLGRSRESDAVGYEVPQFPSQV